jgi:GDP-L-fucose synthase
MTSPEKIFVAGHRGMVGSAIVRALLAHGAAAESIITRTRDELDLSNQAAVQAFFGQERPTQVYLAAAKVGGIHANNSYPAEFIYQNLMVQANVIHAAHTNGVQKLLFLGSSCIYPRQASQPMRETLRKLQPSVWTRLPQRHAHQPLWAWRQLPPGEQPCHSSPAAAL